MRLGSAFQMAQWTVWPRRGVLEANHSTVRVEPRVMDVLCCLAARPGEVITREEFIKEVWRGRVVTDEVLSRCVSQLRTALNDDPREPSFIETVPKIGYRLLVSVGPVFEAPPIETPANSGAGSAPVSRFWFALIGAGLIATLLALVGPALWNKPPPRPVETVAAAQPLLALLPFVSAGTDADNLRLAEGLSEELRHRLSGVPGLKILGKSSSSRLTGQNAALMESAHALRVTHLLAAHVGSSDARLRITAQLLDVPQGVERWSQSFDRDLGDAAAVQVEIARAVAAALLLAPPQGSELRSSRLQSRDPESYRLYLLARGELFRSTDESLASARRRFAEVILRDAQFSEAYAGLASTCAVQARFFDDHSLETEQRGVAAAEEALALDSNSSEAHLARAMLQRLRYERRGDIAGYRAATEDFRQAIALDPANAFAYLNYGFAVSRDDALQANQLYGRALEIDPLLDAAEFLIAVNQRALADYPAARRDFHQLLERGLDPKTSYYQLLITERFAGRPHAAVAAGKNAFFGLDLWAAYLDISDSAAATAVLHAMGTDGDEGTLREAAALAMRGRFREEWRLLDQAQRRLPADGSLAPAAAHLALVAGEPTHTIRIIGERFPGLFGDLEAINAYNVGAALDLIAAWQIQGAADQAHHLLARVLGYFDRNTAFKGPPSTAFHAAAFALRGDIEGALTELERGLRLGYRMLWNVSLTPGLIPAPYPIDGDPRFGTLRNDARFAAWIRKVRAANAQPDPVDSSENSIVAQRPAGQR